jgi:hypothetical protein
MSPSFVIIAKINVPLDIGPTRHGKAIFYHDRKLNEKFLSVFT